MKKWITFLMILTLLFLFGCGESNDASNETSEKESSSAKVLSENDFDLMYTSPKDYKGYEVTFTGQVFTAPERDSDGVYLQVYADPENYEKNTLIAYYNPDFSVNEGDYLKVTGIVKDEFVGENLFGAEITAPLIEAKTMEIVDYITAVAPTINALEINQENEQHGVKIQLEKIEFAKSHTRVYVRVINNSSAPVSIFTYSAKLIVGNQQFENEVIYDADYPEVQSELLAGVESAGILTFPAIDPNTTSFKLVLEGDSDDWEIDLAPFEFTVG